MQMPLIQHPEVQVTTEMVDGDLILRSVVQDDQILALNHQVRNDGHVRSGKVQAPGHPKGAKVGYWFQAHPVLWARHQRLYPEVHQALHSHDRVSRELAAKIIAEQHPEWVVTKPKSLTRK
jgi:hypothetical protein